MKPTTLMTIAILAGCDQSATLNPQMTTFSMRPTAADPLEASEPSGVDTTNSGSTDITVVESDSDGVTDEDVAVTEDVAVQGDTTPIEEDVAVVEADTTTTEDTKAPWCTIVSCPAGTGCQSETGLCLPECESPGVACAAGTPFCLPPAPPYWRPLCVECINDFSCGEGIACEYNTCLNN